MTNRDLAEAAHALALQIAIDGPAGAGKSTVGQGLSRMLHCLYVDTGLMYRFITRQALDRAIPLDDASALRRLCWEATFDLMPGDQGGLRIDGQPTGKSLRTPEVDAAVSEISAHSGVREILVGYQRNLAAGRCVVMVGRDIGTVVLPGAPVKLWITASAESRAGRRRGEQDAMENVTRAVLKEIEARDAFDSSRQASPLKQAADAVVVNTDNLEQQEALDRALEVVRSVVKRRLPSPP